MPRSRRRTALSFGVLSFVAVIVACRDATQVEVRITTGEKCSDLSAVQLVVGPDPTESQKRFEHHFTAAETHDCGAQGLVGTLVLVPGGNGGTIVVAAGVRVDGAPAADAATCSDPANAKRCIIARRSFSFIDHMALSLPIDLDPLCVGQPCDPSSTCFKGSCVASSVVCNGSDCGLMQENPGQPPQGDGSANEGSSSDGAYDAELDGMTSDVVDGATKDGSAVDAADAADSDADAGSMQYPACSMSAAMSASCNATYGKVDPGGCGGVGPPCCHCTCANGSARSCGLSMAGGCGPLFCQ